MLKANNGLNYDNDCVNQDNCY